MKLNKKNILILILTGIVLISYNALFLIIPFSKAVPAQWLVFCFTNVAILGMFPLAVFGLQGDKKVSIFGIPVLIEGLAYFIIQLALNIVVGVIGNLIGFVMWLAVVIEIILTAVLAITVVVAFAFKDAVGKTSSGKELAFSKKTSVLVAKIQNEIENENTLKEFGKLSDKLRYMDPVSCEDVVDIENNIIELMNVMLEQAQSNDADGLSKSINKVSKLIDERKSVLKTVR